MVKGYRRQTPIFEHFGIEKTNQILVWKERDNEVWSLSSDRTH